MNYEDKIEVMVLLRCAFDQSNSIRRTGEALGMPPRIIHMAIKARSVTSMMNHDDGIHTYLDYYDECLEAAMRVSEGSLPVRFWP